MAGTAKNKKAEITPLEQAVQTQAANHTAQLEAHKETLQAIEKLQKELNQHVQKVIRADAATLKLTEAGIPIPQEYLDSVLDQVAERNPKLKKLLVRQETKKSDSDSKFLNKEETLAAIRESGNQALIETVEFQNKMVHWKFWAHRNTRTLLIGIAAGVAITIAIPKLLAWYRGEDATDADGDVVDFEMGDHRMAG